VPHTFQGLDFHMVSLSLLWMSVACCLSLYKRKGGLVNQSPQKGQKGLENAKRRILKAEQRGRMDAGKEICGRPPLGHSGRGGGHPAADRTAGGLGGAAAAGPGDVWPGGAGGDRGVQRPDRIVWGRVRDRGLFAG